MQSPYGDCDHERVKDVENNNQYHFLERQRTRAMISHLKRKESIVNSNIDHFVVQVVTYFLQHLMRCKTPVVLMRYTSGEQS